MSTNLEELVEQLSNLTVLDMSKLKKMLEEKWGVEASAGAVIAQAPAGASEAPAESEATEFNISLDEITSPDKKISVIKCVREISGLGLKEAKEVVESTPKIVKTDVPVAEAKEIKKKLEDAGAKVSLKGV